MSEECDVTPPEEILRALLQQHEVRDLINKELAGKNLPYAVEDLPDGLQLQLVQALITDGAVSIGSGRVLTPDELLAHCEAEVQCTSESADERERS